MADKYHIGQKVRLKNLIHMPEYNGVVTTIMTQQRIYLDTESKETVYGYLLDLIHPRSNLPINAAEMYLEPVYDGDESSSWSNCAWQPKSLVKG